MVDVLGQGEAVEMPESLIVEEWVAVEVGLSEGHWDEVVVTVA